MNYHNIVFETSFGLSSQLPPSDLAEIAFAGRSNVGKSSMINKLFNRKGLARVSRGRLPPSTSSGWSRCALWTCPVMATPRSPGGRNSGGRG